MNFTIEIKNKAGLLIGEIIVSDGQPILRGDIEEIKEIVQYLPRIPALKL